MLVAQHFPGWQDGSQQGAVYLSIYWHLLYLLQIPARFALNRGGGRSRSSSFTSGDDAIASDYSQKMLHLSWHPEANVIATAASNSLYILYGRDGRLQ